MTFTDSQQRFSKRVAEVLDWAGLVRLEYGTRLCCALRVPGTNA